MYLLGKLVYSKRKLCALPLLFISISICGNGKIIYSWQRVLSLHVLKCIVNGNLCSVILLHYLKFVPYGAMVNTLDAESKIVQILVYFGSSFISFYTIRIT